MQGPLSSRAATSPPARPSVRAWEACRPVKVHGRDLHLCDGGAPAPVPGARAARTAAHLGLEQVAGDPTRPQAFWTRSWPGARGTGRASDPAPHLVVAEVQGLEELEVLEAALERAYLVIL